VTTAAEKNCEPQPSVGELREELERSHLQLRLNVAKKQLKLTESFFSPTPYGGLIDPREQYYDGQRYLSPLYTVNRRQNQQPFQTESQLDLQRQFCRYLAETNSYAIGGLEGLTNYVIGRGFGYNLTPLSGASDTLQQMAQKVLEDFLKANDWWQYEREGCERTVTDGDCIFRFFPQDDGPTQIRIVEPECVRAPNSDPEWAFGILTDPEDELDIKAYWVTYDGDPAHGEQVDASEIHHIKAFRTRRNSRRGISDFWAVGEQLEEAKKLIRNMRGGEAVRSAIAYLREHATAPIEAVQALQANNSDFALSYLQPTTGRQVNVQKLDPGSVQDIPEGLTHKSIPAYDSAPGMSILGGTLEGIAARWNAPVWILSGNAADTNYASSLSAESPWVKSVQARQKYYQEHYKKILWRVLEIAVEQGKLPAKALEVLSLQVEAPPVTVRNKQEENTINQTLYNAGLLSGQTWAVREDLDYTEEQQNRSEEAKTFVPPIYQAATRVTEQEGGPGGKGPAPKSDTPPAQYARETNRSSLP
jgi:hypothetical protein